MARKNPDGKRDVVADGVKTLGQQVDAVLRTEEGRALFAHLHRYCAYNRCGLAFDATTRCVEPVTTALNEARRGVYIHLRELASRELLAVAEELAETPVPAAVIPEDERKK